MNDKGLKVELQEDIKHKVLNIRNNFYSIFIARYQELLPMLIQYNHDESINPYSIDFLKLEMGLRNNFDMVVGQNKQGFLCLLGWVQNQASISNPSNIFNTMKPFRKSDINFLIPEENIPNEMKEITMLDNALTGNFVVFRNKALNYTSDFQIIGHYIGLLSEIVASRASLAIQAKAITFFQGEANNESLNQVITDFYNGAPFVKVTELLELNENIIQINQSGLASNMVELKREYQNYIGELNNILGINSLAVDKESGVSDTEAKSNTAFTTANNNLYLATRKNACDLLCKRFGVKLEPLYNDKISSELSGLLTDNNEKGEKNEDHIDPI